MDNKVKRAVYGIQELIAMGFSRPMAYQLLNRNDVPVVVIGGRKFVHAKLFDEWLEQQATSYMQNKKEASES